MSLNEDQQRVIETSSNCLVIAIPGAGKTTTIVQKIGAILSANRQHVVCAVSFTRDAASEMRTRLEKTMDREAMKRCATGTFHSIAKRHLEKYGHTIKIAEDGMRYGFIERAIREARLDITVLDAAKAIETLKSQIDFNPDQDSDEAALYRAYTNLMRRNNVYDLNDIIPTVVTLLREDKIPPLPITHLLADEFQDTDSFQLAYILEYAKRGVVCDVVCDDDQSIYSFRAALGYQGVIHFERMAQATRITLGVNYRCREEILAAAGRLIEVNEERLPKKLIAARGSGGKVKVFAYRDFDAEADAICNAIIKARGRDSDTFKPGLVAILARTNRQLRPFIAALTRCGLPFQRSTKDDFWTSEPACYLVAFLKSLETKETNGIDMMLHFVGVHHDDLESLHSTLGSRFDGMLDSAVSIDLSSFSARTKMILEEFITRAPQWAKNVQEWRHNLVLNGVQAWLSGLVKGDDDQQDIGIAINNLKKMKGSFAQRHALLSSGPKHDKEKHGISLLTMHGAKGLEFNDVYVVAASNDALPSADSPIEEERRLMYVAMTRAKDNLTISYPGIPTVFIHEAKLPIEIGTGI